jgi:hypothetical protein
MALEKRHTIKDPPMLYLAIAIAFVALLGWDVLRRHMQVLSVEKGAQKVIDKRLDTLERAVDNLHSAQSRSATHLHALTGSRKRRTP